MRALRGAWVPLLVISISLAGCGGDDDDDGDSGGPPSDVSGEYTVNVTNQANHCDFDDWTEGESATGIPLTIDQDGSDITGTIAGVVGIYLGVLTGSNEFDGSVSGSTFSMSRFGTTSGTLDDCSYTLNVVIDGELNGNSIEGTVSYERDPNDNPDCADLACTNVQNFSGSRPPK